MLRILPRVNDDVNEEWISDKTRHIVDGLKSQRLDRPYVRKRRAARPSTWAEAFAAIAAKVKANGRRSGSVSSRATSPAPRTCSPSSMLADEARFSLTSIAGRTARCSTRRFGRGFLPLQRNGRRHRDARPRCWIIGSEPAAGEPGAQRPHPQALAHGRNFPIQVIGERADLTYDYDLSSAPEPTR